MVIFYRSRCDGGAYVDWGKTDPNDRFMSEAMAAEMRGFGGVQLVDRILTAHKLGHMDADAEYALFKALYPRQQKNQVIKY